MLTIEKIEGLVAAPFTPMDSNGNLNTEMIPEYYNFLEKNGITGAFINGTTGEGPSLTQKEKQINAKIWAKCLKAGGKVKVINLVGGTSYNECIENAVFSYEEGLSAISVIGPYFFKPDDVNILAEFVARIGEAVPELPVYYYHFPSVTGVTLPMINFLEKISGVLPNFAGIKYTHEDLMDFSSCLNYQNRMYNLLWGRDECMLSALAYGCKGFIGSTYNYAAPLYHKIIEAFNSGDMEIARKLQQKSVEMIRLLNKYGGIAAGKAYMKIIGLDCGLFRLPVKNVSIKLLDSFIKDVKQLEIDNLFSAK
ncbi:MAG: dihydrodipicolinate synthase family protein [Bacteroidales bacterium]